MEELKLNTIIDKNKIWHNLNEVPKDINDELVLVIAYRYNEIIFYQLEYFNEFINSYTRNRQIYKFKYAYVKDLLPTKT